LHALLRKMLKPVLSRSSFDLSVARLRLEEFEAMSAELSAALSMIDAPGQANSRLIELALSCISAARRIELQVLVERQAPALVHLWPGEHYKLLHAIVQETEPRLVLEIGTFTGLSALAMMAALPPGSELVTVDVIPWDRIPGSYLRPSDFGGGRLRQVICDLGEPEVARKYAHVLQNADLIFIDAAKDGVFEYRLMQQIKLVGLKPGALVILDDIRFWNMLRLWREISQPKLDLTSFGHWSGTGLVDWEG